MYLDTKATVDGLEAPTDVKEVHCVYGSKVPTTSSLVYPDTFPDALPTIIYEPDGDGTVNKRSLRACETHWKGIDVHSLEVATTNHMEILSDQRFIDRVKAVAHADENPPPKHSFWYSLLIGTKAN